MAARRRTTKPDASELDRRRPPAPLDVDVLLRATIALGVVAKATDLEDQVRAWLDEQRRIHAEEGGVMRDVVARDGFCRHDLYELIGMLHDIMEMLDTEAAETPV